MDIDERTFDGTTNTSTEDTDQDSTGMEATMDSIRFLQDSPKIIGLAFGAEMEGALLDACTEAPNHLHDEGIPEVTVWGTPLRQYPSLSTVEAKIEKGLGMMFHTQEEWAAFLECDPYQRSRWVFHCLFDDAQYIRKVYGRHPFPDTTATLFTLDLSTDDSQDHA